MTFQAKNVKTFSGRHFETAETDLFLIGMRIVPPYFCRIFIELPKSILQPTFYQKVLAEFGPQNWYPHNFALDPWRHLLRYEPSLWGRGKPVRSLCRRKAWGKKFDGKGSENGVNIFHFGAIFAGTRKSISVSVYRIVGLVGGHLWTRGEARCQRIVQETEGRTNCSGDHL